MKEEPKITAYLTPDGTVLSVEHTDTCVLLERFDPNEVIIVVNRETGNVEDHMRIVNETGHKLIGVTTAEMKIIALHFGKTEAAKEQLDTILCRVHQLYEALTTTIMNKEKP